MKRRINDIFSTAAMLLAALAVVLVGWQCLSWSVRQAGELAQPDVGQAPASPPIYIDVEEEPDPPVYALATPEPTSGIPQYEFDPDIPLSPPLQEAFHQICAEHGLDEALVLGVIEVESGFDPYVESAMGCYGLMQLNRRYFPGDLSPADNLRAGAEYLAELLERYDTPGAALRAYNRGHDDGDRIFANAVLEAAERWRVVDG